MKNTLEHRFLVSDDCFARERENLFHQTWQVVCREEDISNGSFRTESIGNGNIVLVRKSDGSIGAYHNVCRHRGTRLVDCPSGPLKNNCLVCPYHAWTYDCDGSLIGAPNMNEQQEFDKRNFGLSPVPVRIWNGFVVANLSSKPSSKDGWAALVELGETIAPWNLSALKPAAEIRYTVQANWKILFQNYSECYHCPTVHPDLNQLTPYRTAQNDLTNGPILGGPMSLSADVETISENGKFVGPVIPGLNEDQRKQVHYYTIFPSTFLSLHPDYVMVHYLRPLEAGVTDIRCQFLCYPADDGMSNQIENASCFWDQVNRQDWEVCEQTQKGVSSAGYVPGPYSPLESMVEAFDDYYRDLFGNRYD